MNAPIKPLVAAPQRSARQVADVVLVWHEDHRLIANDAMLTSADCDRRAKAALDTARRYADLCAAEADPEMQAMWLSIAGRSAIRSRVYRARARELRGSWA